MAQISRTSGDKVPGDGFSEPQVQAAFDFMPAEMRHRLRFGDSSGADRADFRAQLRLIDRQVIGLGSRIAAARLREILRPVHASEDAAGAPAIFSTTTRELSQQREILREMGTVIFSFRDEPQSSQQMSGPQSQRLHPRPLPARYYEAMPQLSDHKAA